MVFLLIESTPLEGCALLKNSSPRLPSRVLDEVQGHWEAIGLRIGVGMGGGDHEMKMDGTTGQEHAKP